MHGQQNIEYSRILMFVNKWDRSNGMNVRNHFWCNIPTGFQKVKRY